MSSRKFGGKRRQARLAEILQSGIRYAKAGVDVAVGEALAATPKRAGEAGLKFAQAAARVFRTGAIEAGSGPAGVKILPPAGRPK